MIQSFPGDLMKKLKKSCSCKKVQSSAKKVTVWDAKKRQVLPKDSTKIKKSVMSPVFLCLVCWKSMAAEVKKKCRRAGGKNDIVSRNMSIWIWGASSMNWESEGFKNCWWHSGSKRGTKAIRNEKAVWEWTQKGHSRQDQFQLLCYAASWQTRWQYISGEWGPIKEASRHTKSHCL